MPSNSAGLIACLIFGLAEAAVRAPDKDADCEQMPENEACAEYRGHSQLSSALLQRKHNIYQQQALAEEGMALESEKVKESETRPVEEALVESDGFEEELSELEEEGLPHECEPCHYVGCSEKLDTLCRQYAKVKLPPRTRSCGENNDVIAKIKTRNSNLCVPSTGGYVTYMGKPCGANTEIAYTSESDGKTYYAQNIQWEKAYANTIRRGKENLSPAQCRWTWGPSHGYYAGSCGVKPKVETEGSASFPETCWPNEIAKVRAKEEKARFLAEKAELKRQIAALSLLSAVEEDAAIEEREEQGEADENDAAEKQGEDEENTADEEQQLTKFKKQDLMIQEDVENTADEKEDLRSEWPKVYRELMAKTFARCLPCKEWYYINFQIDKRNCPSELLALCDKHSRALVSCSSINHRIVTTNSNLCVPKNGGGVSYKGQPCGENTEISYDSELGKKYYAQNVQWVSAKADDLRSGMSEAQCEWTWGADQAFYAGSCGVEPVVATINNTHFPKTCWPDEIAKEVDRVEKKSLEAKIVELKGLVESVVYANRRISHLEAFSLATPLARTKLYRSRTRVSCAEIHHRIFTTNSNLCQTSRGGNVIYKGKPCGENTNVPYDSESGVRYYAQNIQWVSAKASNPRNGLSEAQCEWTWGADHEFYAGSCGVLPRVGTSKNTHFPFYCWPDEVAKEKDRLETQSLKAKIVELKVQIANFEPPQLFH